jgi:CDP-glycerol glycerophosphotransferase
MMVSKEKAYIFYRKIKAFGNSLCFYLCRVFPVHKDRVAVCTFEGKGGFGCNPKYLVEELHAQRPETEFIWLVNDMKKEFPPYIKKVPNTLWSRTYWLSTSKIWIDNYRKPYGTKKRRKQYYLNVNHYTLGIKCTGLLRGDGFSEMAYLVSKNDSDMVDGLVIDSVWCEKNFVKAFLYDGPMLKTGAPRCDILYGSRQTQKENFRKKHGLRTDDRVVLFAPTFREGSRDGKRFVFSEEWTLDFERLLRTLEKKFGHRWYICVRLHPQLAPAMDEYHNEAVKDRLIDESKGEDLYELLAGMDAYITDYSSAVFEAGYAHIPAFIYADDIKTFSAARGNLYWNLTGDDRHHIENNRSVTPDMELVFPFPVASDNDQLEEDIMGFDEASYNRTLDAFHESIDLVFDGQASRKLAEKIAGISQT